MVVWHLKQIGKVKKLNKWVPRELTTNQKNHRFEVSSSLILCNNKEPFLDQIVTCNEKWLSYNNRWSPAQWLDWKEAPKHFLKPNFSKKRSWSLFGGLSLVWSTTAFWILAKPLHLRSMLSKLMRYTENCSACIWHWSKEKIQLFSMTVPDLSDHTGHITNALKVGQIGLQTFASSAILLTDYHFFNHLDNFLQRKCFHNQQEAENAFQEFVKSWSMDFYATGINKLFLIGTMCWL